MVTGGLMGAYAAYCIYFVWNAVNRSIVAHDSVLTNSITNAIVGQMQERFGLKEISKK